MSNWVKMSKEEHAKHLLALEENARKQGRLRPLSLAEVGRRIERKSRKSRLNLNRVIGLRMNPRSG